MYVGRVSLASAIFIAAVLNWRSVSLAPNNTLVISLAFALTAVVTAGSAVYTEIYRRPPGPTFLYLQAIYDLLLVTAVVHVTTTSSATVPGVDVVPNLAASSQFSAVYILVIATATLLLPTGGGLWIAALGNVLYIADVALFIQAPLDASVWLQLTVFAVVALGSAYLTAQLRESGEGKEQLAAELVHARLQAEDILRNIRSGVITVDTNGRLLYANPTAEQLLGIELRTRIGQRVLELVSNAAPELSNAMERAARHKIRTTRGEAMVSLDSRRFPVGVTTTYTEDDAKALRSATAIFQDISDQKRIDALRLRAERLEGIAELSASLAHEIKNPLASIRSAVEQLARRPRNNADERTLSDLVLRESDRLSRLLSEFLDFARVRVGHTEPVDLVSVARGAAGLAAAHPDRQQSVTIACVAPDGEVLRVDGDEDLLHRAVFNLALNAVQASPPDSEVKIELAAGGFEPLPIGVNFDGGTVALRVSDRGPGIPAEYRDRLFDPFFTTKPQGSGLGLAVVQRAIEAHRGLVFVDSSNQGTRFTVILPRSQAAAQSVA